MRKVCLAAFAGLVLVAGMRHADAQCPGWKPGFQAPGIGGGGHALLVHDFGQGPRLVVGGELDLTSPDTSGESSVLAWDGVAWASLAGGPPGAVQALAAWNDGSGPALYAGGAFFSAGGHGVSRWNGASWTAVGAGLNGSVFALAVFDDGSGSALYAGGEFNVADGQTVGRVARWNGSTWSVVGTAPAIGPNNRVRALAVFDDGTGAALYAGGDFTGTGGNSANRVAKWDGTSWSPLGSGVGATVYDLIVHDDGSGPALYAGGTFGTAGGQTALGVARWNGTSWSSLGSPGLGNVQAVKALGNFDDGSGAGTKLHVSGMFSTAGGMPADGFAIWDGASWSAPGTRLDAHAFATFDAGAGRVLVATGPFARVGNVHAVGLALWDGSAWAAPNVGLGITLAYPQDNENGGYVSVLKRFDDGTGTALYAAGAFTLAGSSVVASCARFDGQGWTNMGPTGVSFNQALEVHDDGTGPTLYMAGGSSTGPAVRRWNGSTWSAFAPPLQGETYDALDALCSFDDGSGPALYVGGTFTGVPGVALANVARWDGTAWSPLGTGTDGAVTALAVFDDGTGPALYAGGEFDTAGGTIVNGVARWNGTTWSALGTGVGGSVYALYSFDDGSGPALYVGGHFFSAGGSTALNAARWRNSSWSALGGGVQHSAHFSGQRVETFLGWDEGTGSGPVLFAAGIFTHAGGIVSHGIARWDGTAWSDVGGGVLDSDIDFVLALETFDDGTGGGADLFVAGEFELAGDKPSSRIAAWSGCDEVGRTLCYGDGSGTACPCGNASAPGDREGCVNSTGLGGRLRASGTPSLASDTLVLSGSRMTNGSALYFQGTARVNGGAGVVFGDGLRCAAGTVVRLAVLTNSAGASHYPRAGDPPVAMQGSVAQPGARVYQVWFRDAASFCTPDTFALTNAVEIVWQP